MTSKKKMYSQTCPKCGKKFNCLGICGDPKDNNHCECGKCFDDSQNGLHSCEKQFEEFQRNHIFNPSSREKNEE